MKKTKSIFILLTIFVLLANSAVDAQISTGEIDAMVEKAMKEFNVAGVAVAVIKDGKIIHEKGYGVRSIDSKQLVNEHTDFQIASNSKAFTTAALAILVEEGKLAWKDSVKKYLPEFKMYNDYVTENFLEVVKNTAGLEKVIFVASVAAWNTSFPMLPAGYESNHIFSENDAPYYSENDMPYAQAKHLADQAVRKFTAENADLNFEIVTVSPVLVIGDALSDKRDFSSQTLLRLIKNKVTDEPFVAGLFAADPMLSMVDVRDVAEAVFQSAVKPNLHGKNYLIAGESYKISDISLMLNSQPPVSDAAQTYSNALAKNDLGIDFISAKDTLNDL